MPFCELSKTLAVLSLQVICLLQKHVLFKIPPILGNCLVIILYFFYYSKEQKNERLFMNVLSIFYSKYLHMNLPNYRKMVLGLLRLRCSVNHAGICRNRFACF